MVTLISLEDTRCTDYGQGLLQARGTIVRILRWGWGARGDPRNPGSTGWL